jgi:hypothetical protein
MVEQRDFVSKKKLNKGEKRAIAETMMSKTFLISLLTPFIPKLNDIDDLINLKVIDIGENVRLTYDTKGGVLNTS